MKKHILPFVLCLLGGSVGGAFGLAAGGLMSVTDGRVDDRATFFLFSCGAFSGACLGATPGLIVWYRRGARWVCPFLGAAIGSLPGMILFLNEAFSFTSQLGRSENFFGDPGHLTFSPHAILVLLGFLLGTAIAYAPR
jgi:hypothetical protein